MNKLEKAGENLEKVGNGLNSCGSAIMSIVALVVIIFLFHSCMTGSSSEDTSSSHRNSFSETAKTDSNNYVFTNSESESLYNDDSAISEIKSKAESTVPPQYKGNTYCCDILTNSGGSGYSISIQITTDGLDKSQSTNVCKQIKNNIESARDSRITKVSVSATQNSQIVDTE